MSDTQTQYVINELNNFGHGLPNLISEYSGKAVFCTLGALCYYVSGNSYAGLILPVAYSKILSLYNASNLDIQAQEFAANYFLPYISAVTKNYFFDKSNNISAQEANKLFISFRAFIKTHHGFNTNLTNNHPAFLRFLYESQKIDQLAILVKLGANQKDCDFEDYDATQCVGLKAGKNSLQWLSAKALIKKGGSPYLDNIVHKNQEDAITSNAIKTAVADIVETARKYC